jgi:hypothetical protein
MRRREFIALLALPLIGLLHTTSRRPMAFEVVAFRYRSA